MSTVVDLKTKEEKDAELDRRIEALRKKNEALVRRYQEIEEDKKKAEQEGIAVTTPRKPRSHEHEVERRKTEKENFTVTVDLSKPSGEKRVVNDRKGALHHGEQGPEEGDGFPRPQGESPPRRTGSGRLNRGGQRGGGGPRSERREPRPDRQPWDGESGDGPPRGERNQRGGRRGGRGGGGGTPGGGSGSDRKSKEWEEKRRQNIEKMNEEMEKIAEYERGQRADGDKNPTRNFLDDPRRSGPIPDTDRKEGSRRHIRNWGGLDFDNVKTGAEVEKEWTSRRPGGKGSVDMTLSMTGRERAEYLRWKKEREQIDEERLARHRNATGQWRREWDAQKTDNMFKEDAAVAVEGTPEQSNRRAARGRNARAQQRSGASEDGKRPPKAPTFGDFLGHGKSREAGRRGRGRGKGQTQGKSYSMHDNRWEGEKEEEKGKKEETEKEKDEKKPKASSSEKEQPKEAEEKPADRGTAEEDDDEWEDASDGDEEEVGEDGEESEGEEQKSQNKDSPIDKTPTSPAPPAQSPKEQRTPRPKVRIPSPQEIQATPELATKPLSPFSPLEGHQPVTDWGEEMEMLSPRSSLGESPLKPGSNEGSPSQAKSQEEEQAKSSQPAEQEKQDNTQTETSEETSSSSSKEPAETTTTTNQDIVVSTPPPAQDSTASKEETPAPVIEPNEKLADSQPPAAESAADSAVESSEQPSSG